MPNTYVIIGVLSIALAGAGYFGVVQTEALGVAKAKVESLEATIIEKDKAIFENNMRIATLQSDNQVLNREKAANAEKALKDITRVERIAARKAKLYEKLVNRDFKKTQDELRELTR